MKIKPQKRRNGSEFEGTGSLLSETLVVVCNICCGDSGGALFYLKVTPTTSTTYSVVMFNQDEDDTPASSGLLGSLMSSFSMGGTGVNLDDEIFASRAMRP